MLFKPIPSIRATIILTKYKKILQFNYRCKSHQKLYYYAYTISITIYVKIKYMSKI